MVPTVLLELLELRLSHGAGELGNTTVFLLFAEINIREHNIVTRVQGPGATREIFRTFSPFWGASFLRILYIVVFVAFFRLKRRLLRLHRHPLLLRYIKDVLVTLRFYSVPKFGLGQRHVLYLAALLLDTLNIMRIKRLKLVLIIVSTVRGALPPNRQTTAHFHQLWRLLHRHGVLGVSNTALRRRLRDIRWLLQFTR